MKHANSAKERAHASLLLVANRILTSPASLMVQESAGISVLVLVMVADNDDPGGMPLVGAPRVVSGITVDQAADGLVMAAEAMSPTCGDCGSPLTSHERKDVH